MSKQYEQDCEGQSLRSMEGKIKSCVALGPLLIEICIPHCLQHGRVTACLFWGC